MKIITFLAILFISCTSIAQNLEKWPAMESVDMIISRMDSNVKQGFDDGLSRFSGTLKHSVDQLSAEQIPSQYKTKVLKKEIKNLQKSADHLNSLVEQKASIATIKQAFSELSKAYAAIKSRL